MLRHNLLCWDDAVRGVGQVEVLQVSERSPQLRVHGLQEPTLAAGQPPQPGVLEEGVSVNVCEVEGADVQILQSSGAGKVTWPQFPQVSF